MIPHFTHAEVAQMLTEFSTEHNVIIDECVVQDIFALTNGHPGLVGILGHMIERLVCKKIYFAVFAFFFLG